MKAIFPSPPLSAYASLFPRKTAMVLIMLWCLATPATFGSDQPPVPVDKPNVLLIIVDDLRPQIGAYGASQIKTPNMDHLASKGILFRRAFCQAPTCGASRASMLTGLYPNHRRFTNYRSRADEEAPHARTLPEHLKKNGYYTVSRGKVFHASSDSKEVSWSEEPTRVHPHPYDYQEHPYGKRSVAWEIGNAPESSYLDPKVAQQAIEDLGKLKDKNQPFFLAVGFVRPHLPFNAPRKYYEMYPLSSIEVADNPEIAENAPGESSHNFNETRKYSNVPDSGDLPVSLQKNLIRGYYASVSFVDAQVGRVLDELEGQGLDENTVVILVGDHGYNLGEHGLWSKHSLYNTSDQVPLIVRLPNGPRGVETRAVTDLVDIYPTLCNLLGLPQPDHLQGTSFAPVLRDPTTAVKDHSFTVWRGGERIYTHDDYAFARWLNEQGETAAYMMFNHRNDPKENHSLLRGQHPDLYDRLHTTTQEHMTCVRTAACRFPTPSSSR